MSTIRVSAWLIRSSTQAAVPCVVRKSANRHLRLGLDVSRACQNRPSNRTSVARPPSARLGAPINVFGLFNRDHRIRSTESITASESLPRGPGCSHLNSAPLSRRTAKDARAITRVRLWLVSWYPQRRSSFQRMEVLIVHWFKGVAWNDLALAAVGCVSVTGTLQTPWVTTWVMLDVRSGPLRSPPGPIAGTPPKAATFRGACVPTSSRLWWRLGSDGLKGRCSTD